MNKKNIVQKVVLGAVIIKNNKALIIQRNKDEKIFPSMWELPSGKKEPLEDPIKSLLREVKEEVGLKVKVIMPFSVFNYQIEKEEELRDSTQINILVKPITSVRVKLSSEHQNFAWINKIELDNYNLSKKTKKVLKEAFSIMKKLKK